jgi:uncharacterized protein with FMN-binding domain
MAENEQLAADLAAAQAELESVKALLAQAQEALLAEEAAAEEEVAAEPAVLTGTAKGLFSDVVVTVVLDADGAIAEITVDCSGETVIAKPCAGKTFLSQFIGKKGPFAEVDAVSGATHTSNAVLEAINSIFTK